MTGAEKVFKKQLQKEQYFKINTATCGVKQKTATQTYRRNVTDDFGEQLPDQLYISATEYVTGCVLFQIKIALDRSRFVRRDQSSPVKKNTQIFLVVVGVVI